MVKLIMRKLHKDYGLHVHDHVWLKNALVKYSGWDASTAAFMIANAWQKVA